MTVDVSLFKTHEISSYLREETKISTLIQEARIRLLIFDRKPDKALILIPAGIAYGYYAIMITTTTSLNIILTSKWNMHNKFLPTFAVVFD